MDVNFLVEVVKQGAEILQPAVSTIVGVVLSTLFVRKNTNTTEFEKIKAGKFEEAIDLLLKNGKMTYYEYYKFHNFFQIAKRIDKYGVKNINSERIKEFDFDWFMRFLIRQEM